MSNNYSYLILIVFIVKLVIHHIMQSMLFFSVLAMIFYVCNVLSTPYTLS